MSIAQDNQAKRTPQLAILGNAAGLVPVAPRRGLSRDVGAEGWIWVRYNGGEIQVWGDGRVGQKDSGYPVEIEPIQGMPGIYRVANYALAEARDGGVDVRVITNRDVQRVSLWLQDDANDGRAYIDKDSSQGFASTFGLRRGRYGLWRYDGTYTNLERGYGNAIDLSAAQPSASNEAYTLEYYDEINDTDSYVSFLSRSSTGEKLTTAQRQTALQALPHQHCVPGAIYRLAGGVASLTPEDYRGSLRQLWNTHLPSGFPRILKRNWVIAPDYEQLITGSIKLNDGVSLKLGDGATLRKLS